MGALQTEIERRGERIFDLVDQHPESLFSKAGFYQRMMALSMRDEHFKVQLFRFVDVLASLHRGTDIVQHLDEYFAGMRNGYAPLIRTGVRAARIVPWVSGQLLRWNVSGMARQFIAGRNPKDVMKMLRKRRSQGIGFTVDLLGEAVVSEPEANEYASRCLELLEHLGRETRGWTDPLGKNTELFPVVNLSIKISALYSQMNPADPADAIIHLAPKLRPILRRARDLGAFVNFDMESYVHKNATLELFRTLFTETEFRDWPHVGIVIQAYLRDAENDLLDLLDWGRARGTRFAVRLVKGAYWDFEKIKSRQNGWACPVFLQKPESDLNFELLTRILLENESTVTAAFGSQNVSEDKLLRNPAELVSQGPNGARHVEVSSDGASLDTPAGDTYENAPLVNFVYEQNQDRMREALAHVRTQLGQKYPLVINGEKVWTEKTIASINPSSPEDVVGHVAEAGIPEAERAVKAARDAFEKWSRTSFETRCRLLERAADIMHRRRFELSALEVFEVGKAWAEADGDIREAMDFCRFYAHEMRLIGRPRLTQHVLGEESYQHYWPRGVALIIDADADLDEAIVDTIYSAFGYQGQKCSACSRLIILEEIYPRAIERLLNAAASLRVGNPEEPGITVGPVIDGTAHKRILEYIDIGKNESRLAFQRTDVPQKGFFIPPTIFTNVSPKTRIACEEIFGPVLSVMKARDLDEAFEIANSTEFALTAGFFSRSPANIERAKAEIVAGNVYVNRSCTGAVVGRHPFGGFKMSGGGTKAGGADYLLQFVVPRVVTENITRHGFAPETTPLYRDDFLGPR